MSPWCLLLLFTLGDPRITYNPGLATNGWVCPGRSLPWGLPGDSVLTPQDSERLKALGWPPEGIVVTPCGPRAILLISAPTTPVDAPSRSMGDQNHEDHW